MLAALTAVSRGAKGQVVTTSIAQGATSLMPMIYGLYAAGDWVLEPDRNILDGGAPFYRCYETKDGRYMAIAAIEAQVLRGTDRQARPDRPHQPRLGRTIASIGRKP